MADRCLIEAHKRYYNCKQMDVFNVPGSGERFGADRCDYERASAAEWAQVLLREEGRGGLEVLGVVVGGGAQPCYCYDDHNPSIQLMVCHRQGRQPWGGRV